MPTLNWIGKDKVINHHLDVPFKVLDHKYSFDGKKKKKEIESENKIIHGDNLEALKSLLPEYEGRIKCIYIDPPYNTGNENWVYNDNVNHPKINKWLGEIVGKEGEDLSRHDKWLCMMYPRLQLLHKLLDDDGIILISIGEDELPNLLLICNEIFGKNFHDATFIWKSRTKPTNAGVAKYRPQKVTEYVLLYAMNKNLLYNTMNGEDNYSYPHEDEEGNFRTVTILTSNLGSYVRETMRFTINDYTPPPDKRWKAGEKIIQDLFDNNRIQFNDGMPMQKVYNYDNDAINSPLYTLIDQKLSGTAESGKTLLNNIIGKNHGFDTVKPLELIHYFVKVFTKNDSLILDSFAGTGTTAHALLKLNKEDGGNRKFILVEMEDYADTITAERVKRVIKGYGENSKAVEGTGGDFNYYTLGEPLFIEENILNENVPLQKIREYIYYSETNSPFKEPDNKADNKYFLGSLDNRAYYFYYEKEKITTLGHRFLKSIKTRAESYLIYADNCLLSEEFLKLNNIIFKKIPRDIKRF